MDDHHLCQVNFDEIVNSYPKEIEEVICSNVILLIYSAGNRKCKSRNL